MHRKARTTLDTQVRTQSPTLASAVPRRLLTTPAGVKPSAAHSSADATYHSLMCEKGLPT